MKTLVWTALFLLVGATAARSESNVVQFDQDGEATLSCKCLALTTAASCVLPGLGDSTAETITWRQTAFVMSGVQLDLTELCYRKRNVDSHGNGLCCGSDRNDNADLRFFRGELIDVR